MVFKPLCILAQCLCALGGFEVFEVHDAFPRTLQAQRVAIALDETVDEIDQRLCVLHPGDAVLVERLQVARLIV